MQRTVDITTKSIRATGLREHLRELLHGEIDSIAIKPFCEATGTALDRAIRSDLPVDRLEGAFQAWESVILPACEAKLIFQQDSEFCRQVMQRSAKALKQVDGIAELIQSRLRGY